MPQLEELVKDVIEKRIAANAAHEAEITQLTKVIAGEQKEIENDYAKIGELYYKQNSDKTEGELGEMVAKVNESNKKIKDSKMKIGTLMGYTFCETCGEQVDEDDLYCNNCGAKMPVKVLPGMELCPHCNKAVRAGIRFCTNCGKPMQEEEKPKVKECPSCGFTTEDLLWRAAIPRRKLLRLRSSPHTRYAPPADSRFLTLKQCSVRSATEDLLKKAQRKQQNKKKLIWGSATRCLFLQK